ncbi:tetratricopeptide repeat protein [Colwellia sp. 1_MG-2023]|uniref:tetratricopeptide repeat protein n=1 Tax=Colwellia sp. 1_MG-2023 TaxID=3062649 RepID=UPI0026E317C1|nr:tetratricopeptide repeat protein [Colwellia sp. 1_MG-2023]MDO6445184.1 tetratricopeptide repeat protein [Colwellia sp. 1_MG-2023]
MNRKIIALSFAMTLSFASYADFSVVNDALEAGDPVAAEQVFTQLSKKDKASVQGQVLAGRIMLDNGESEEAFEHFEALRDDHRENVEVNYYLGLSAVIMAQKASIFSKLGYAEVFLEAMEKTIALQPDHIDALNTLIGFHLAAPSIAGGDTEKALTYANQLKKVDAEQGIEQLANVYWQTEKAALAEQTLQKGLEKFPESASLYFTRATSYMKNKAWGKARDDLNLAIKYASNDKDKSRALYQQGKTSAESGEEIELGIRALSQALPLAEKAYKPWIEYRLTQLYIQNKNFTKAKDTLSMINTSEDDDLKSKVKKLKKKLKKLTS